jgi:hypothetical protein
MFYWQFIFKKIFVCWDATPWRRVNDGWHFGGVHCLHFQYPAAQREGVTKKTEEVRSYVAVDTA